MPSNSFQQRPCRRHRGQTLVEYAMILAIISVFAISVMLELSGNVQKIYCNIDSQVARSTTGS